jgi:hypothetical protein
MMTYSPVENAVMVWNWSCVWEYGTPGMGFPEASLHTKSNVASVVTLLIWISKVDRKTGSRIESGYVVGTGQHRVGCIDGERLQSEQLFPRMVCTEE